MNKSGSLTTQNRQQRLNFPSENNEDEAEESQRACVQEKNWPSLIVC